MSDLSMFNGDESVEGVRKVCELYDNPGQQDVFMLCLREAYQMGHLQWKNGDMRIALESLLNRHIVYCGGEPDLPFAGHHDVDLFNLCKTVLKKDSNNG